MNKISQIIILIVFLLSNNLNAQNNSTKYFNLCDTVFSVGDTYFFPEIIYESFRVKNPFKPLDSVIVFLQKNPKIVVEISVHTDLREIPMTNDTLSKYRADNIVKYLISKGIESRRLIAEGYGSKKTRCLEKDYVSVYNGNKYLFPKGTCLTRDYIINLLSKDEKEAACSLCNRSEMKILKIE
ncbi:MAG: OmpA family protein [Bacteroidota bacterium]